jgi:hypothetical protein
MFTKIREKKRGIYGGWLMIGAVQLLGVAVSGNLWNDSLFSEPPAEASERKEVPQTVTLRISRGLFERGLTAKIDLSNIEEKQSLTSSVRWNEYAEPLPPALLEPGQTPLAIFDDHIGCAEFSDLAPMRVCFKIQSDVSSVALTSDQMWLEGPGAVLDPKCLNVMNLVRADRSDDGLLVMFQLIPKPTSSCASLAGTLTLSLTSRALSAKQLASSRY